MNLVVAANFRTATTQFVRGEVWRGGGRREGWPQGPVSAVSWGGGHCWQGQVSSCDCRTSRWQEYVSWTSVRHFERWIRWWRRGLPSLPKETEPGSFLEAVFDTGRLGSLQDLLMLGWSYSWWRYRLQQLTALTPCDYSGSHLNAAAAILICAVYTCHNVWIFYSVLSSCCASFF